jgi:hypothetical protein
MMNMRELIIEYILFAYEPQELLQEYHISAEELDTLSDQDLLEIYDTTLLTPINR